MLICPKCNIKYGEDKKFCKSCGSKLIEEIIEKQPTQQAIKEKKFPLMPVILSIIGVLVIVGIVTIAIKLSKPITTKTILQEKSYDSQLLTQKDKEEIKNLVYGWKEAWENFNLEAYMGYYSPSFYAPYKKMNYYQWKEYKKGLFRKYSWITINIGNISITGSTKEAKVSFYQEFNSDKYSDKGNKILILKKIDNEWKIVSEDFVEY